MQKKACPVCGREVESGAMEKHYVVPKEIVEETGVSRPKSVRLCPDCHKELLKWYASNVADVVYDNGVKRFRARSSPEMVKEYQTAYQQFLRYKRQQRIA